MTGGARRGGLIGYDLSSYYNDTITSSYWDIEATGVATSAGKGGEGKTTQEMLDESTYQVWNFTKTWTKEPNSYPDLRFLGTKTEVFRWIPTPQQVQPAPYMIGFDTYDGETNPALPDDSIDVDVDVR